VIDARVSVLTPTREGREARLVEAIESVAAQTLPPEAHLVMLDADREGPAVARNALLAVAETPLVAFLDDDDLLDPDHLERLVSRLAREEADVAWSYCRTEGVDAVRVPRPRNDREFETLMRGGRNCVPVTVVARAEAIRAAGGFDPRDRYEDYSLWMRLLRLGAVFSCERRETWTYRFLGENRTWL
jgi:glycosyltransferase involved in cell wall biosynthesis